MAEDFRIERDSMGEMRVPAGALYGAQTARAIANFPISGRPLPRSFLHSLALIKSVAARVNGARGYLPSELASRIEAAAEEVIAGRHDDQFPIDVFQTGSGTSTNMNLNEVIGRLSGTHPNDHVNRGMSSNDAIPSALHIAAARSVHDGLLPALAQLEHSLNRKTKQFHDVFTIGRTHLQDAVPIRLGQRFCGYTRQVAAARERLVMTLPGIYELPLGGTAVGTGLNAPPAFAAEVIAGIATRTGLPFVEARDHFEAQAGKDAVAFLSAALRNCAIALAKIANDIRWLGALGELVVPAVQPGSSIMPGKVNPVIAESVLMVCAQVIGHDAAIAWSAAGGNFELNAMMPVMAYDLLESIAITAASARNFAAKLVDGLEADREKAAQSIERSLAMTTALAPEIGYERAAELAKEAHSTGRTIRDVAREKSGLAPGRVDQLLDPRAQV